MNKLELFMKGERRKKNEKFIGRKVYHRRRLEISW
jgi:hypothetical protein